MGYKLIVFSIFYRIFLNTKAVLIFMKLTQTQNQFHNLEYQLRLQQKIEQNLNSISDIFEVTPEDKYSVLVPIITDLFEKENFEVDREKLQEGLKFAIKHHLGHYRDSGIPYVSHSVQVASLINMWRLSNNKTISALLHDVVEENESRNINILNKIFGLFGQEVLTDVMILSTFEVDRLIRDKNHFNKIIKYFQETGDAGVLYIKSADAIGNTYTKKYMVAKNGLTAQERQRNYVRGILNNNLPITKYLDGLQEIDLNLTMYLKKLAKS
jgi:(p)ppGpp synthase/HD superfamily hydrolase